MEKLELYTRGTKAWFRDKDSAYVNATLLERIIKGQQVVLKFKADDGRELDWNGKLADIEKSKNDTGPGALPLLRNPPHLEGCDDLTTLSYLHEAAVVSSIKIRYLDHKIYTYSGLVLVAMNPFAKVDIYSRQMMKEFVGKTRNQVVPHVYAVAEEAYRKMILFNENQSIIVSGESGAGKTVNAKFVMRYFAAVDDLSRYYRFLL